MRYIHPGLGEYLSSSYEGRLLVGHAFESRETTWSKYYITMICLEKKFCLKTKMNFEEAFWKNNMQPCILNLYQFVYVQIIKF